MVEQSGIGLVILFDAFFATFKLNQDIGRRFPFKMAFDGKKRRIMFDDLAIYSVEITLGIGQIMHRIQNVGFSASILACYAVAFLGFGNDNVRGNPITNILLVSSASVLTLIAFVITGFLLGVSFGSFSRVLITILGNGIWALFVTPLILPIVTRLHRTLFGNQAHI